MARRPSQPGIFEAVSSRPKKVASDRIFVSGANTGGTPGPTGPPGIDGISAGLNYKFNTQVSVVDPTAGKLSLNNAAPASATTICLSETDDDGNGVASYLATWDDMGDALGVRGHLFIRKVGTPGTFALYAITGTITDNGTWDTFTIAHIASAGSFASNDEVQAIFLNAGKTGAAGRDAGFAYIYLTDTANTDPGNGNLKFDSTTFASITTLRISETDGDGNTVFNFLATLDDPTSAIKGHILMRKVGAPGTFALFSITGALTDNGTWDSLVIALVTSGGGSFVNGDAVRLNFSRTGDKGDVGPQGPAASPTPGWLSPCRAATTANITIATALNSGDVIDGVTLANGDRVLVKDQTTKSENGIYVVSASPARATDADTLGELISGTTVGVTEGTINGDSDFTITTDGAITPGTTAHDWKRITALDFGMVTALPASPPNGSFCTLTDSLSAPTYRWRLQYNISSSSSSKWECIGGTPMLVSDDTNRSITSTTYAAVPTASLTATIPVAGDYDIEIQGRAEATASGERLFHSYDVGATAALDNWAGIAGAGNTLTSIRASMAKKQRHTGLAASTVINERAKVSAGTHGLQARRIWIMPVRVG